MTTSALEAVCQRLLRTSGSIVALAAELGGLARSLRASAARVAACGSRGSTPVATTATVERLLAAAASCERAAALLVAADREGRGFVARTVGGDHGAGDAGSGSATPPNASGGGSSRGGLSAEQRVFVEAAMTTSVGVAFFAPDDATLRRSARRVPAFPGEFVADVHGSPQSVRLGVRPPVHLDAAGFAAVLRASGWSGRPIRLFSCRTGREDDGFAQQLADELGVAVTAPTTAVGLADDGQVTVADHRAVWLPDVRIWVWTAQRPGEWRRFAPAKVSKTGGDR